MVSAEALSRLLQTLYSTPTAPELWPDFLREFAILAEVSGAAVMHHDTAIEKYGLRASVGLDPEANAKYESYYGTLDEWRKAAMKYSEGETMFGEELCPREQLRKTEYYNDFLLKCDTRLFWGVATLKRDSRLQTISLFTSWKHKQPSDDAIEFLELVAPHIKSALRTWEQMAAMERAKLTFEDALHNSPKASLLLDRNGKCLFLNQAAQRLLNRRRGLAVVGSRLVATAAGDRARLDALISNCCSGELLASGGGVVAVHRPEKKPLLVSVRRFRHESGTYSDQAVAIVLIADPDDAASPESMALSFGLTPAESRVATLLLDGCSLQEAADCSQVTRETIKAQLKSIFNKTGVKKQAELVKLLMSYR